MASFLKTQTEWNIYWTSYRGRVRVVDRYGSVEYGETTGETFAEQYQEPGMTILLDSGKEVWIHPEHVWPVEYQGEDDAWQQHIESPTKER